MENSQPFCKRKLSKNGAMMVQWRERSPPTNVARVRPQVPVSYVG